MAERGPVSNLGNKANTRGFQKGRSGNPGGRTSAQVAIIRLQHELVAQGTEGGREIVAKVLEIMRSNPETGPWGPKSITWALDFLASRLWGRAPVTVVFKPEGRLEPEDMRKMSLAELEELARGEDQAALPPGESEDDEPTGDVH